MCQARRLNRPPFAWVSILQPFQCRRGICPMAMPWPACAWRSDVCPGLCLDIAVLAHGPRSYGRWPRSAPCRMQRYWKRAARLASISLPPSPPPQGRIQTSDRCGSGGAPPQAYGFCHTVRQQAIGRRCSGMCPGSGRSVQTPKPYLAPGCRSLGARRGYRQYVRPLCPASSRIRARCRTTRGHASSDPSAGQGLRAGVILHGCTHQARRYIISFRGNHVSCGLGGRRCSRPHLQTLVMHAPCRTACKRPPGPLKPAIPTGPPQRERRAALSGADIDTLRRNIVTIRGVLHRHAGHGAIFNQRAAIRWHVYTTPTLPAHNAIRPAPC